MSDLDFFFDPVCPWAWITSRWVTDVQASRQYEVSWKFISLRMINSDRGYAPDSPYEKIHTVGLQGLRVASAARAKAGNSAVAAFYTQLGTALHVQGRREAIASPQQFFSEIAASAGLPIEIADAWQDAAHDSVIRYETDLALSRTGKDVGTPILTFAPNSDRAASLFGPVISKAPVGDEAVKLWDAVQTLAQSGVAEFKRSLRAAPDFT